MLPISTCCNVSLVQKSRPELKILKGIWKCFWLFFFFPLLNLVGNKKKLCMWFPYVLKSFPLVQEVPVQSARSM